MLGSQLCRPNSSCTAVYKLDVINIIIAVSAKKGRESAFPLWSLTISSLRIIHSTFGKNFRISLRGNAVPLSFPVRKNHIMFIHTWSLVTTLLHLSVFLFHTHTHHHCMPYRALSETRSYIYCREGHCVVAQGEVNRFNGLITILKPPPLTCL